MMIDWMKSNDVEYEHIKKRAHDREDIGGLDLSDKAEHTRERERVTPCSCLYHYLVDIC